MDVKDLQIAHGKPWTFLTQKLSRDCRGGAEVNPYTYSFF